MFLSKLVLFGLIKLLFYGHFIVWMFVLYSAHNVFILFVQVLKSLKYDFKNTTDILH